MYLFSSVCLKVMGLSTPGQAEITSLDSGNIDEVLSKASHFTLKSFL